MFAKSYTTFLSNRFSIAIFIVVYVLKNLKIMLMLCGISYARWLQLIFTCLGLSVFLISDNTHSLVFIVLLNVCLVALQIRLNLSNFDKLL